MRAMRLHGICGTIALAVLLAAPVQAVLQPLAYYHLGESDPGAVAGGLVTTTVESLGLTPNRDMTVAGDPAGISYSSDTPDYTTSTLSVQFNNSDPYLFTEATPWYQGTGGFRWGAEMFVKPDASMNGVSSIFFQNGNADFNMGITPNGVFYLRNETFVNEMAPGPGITPVKFGEWQHVAFFTSGSFWQLYVDGVPQYTAPRGVTNYGPPSGTASLGSDLDAIASYTGLIDEHRIFTWTGAFNPRELLWYQARPAGDVNEDGMVDSGDYNIWRMNVGADLTGKTDLEGRGLGDLNGDRQIDLIDFGIIKANKTAGARLIPEPAAATLLALGAAVFGLRRRLGLGRGRLLAAVLLLVSAIVLPADSASAQIVATWNGGSGNWNDANWTGGSGPGGRPGAGDSVLLPATTGTLTVNNNVGLTFDGMNQQGGILDITPTGRLDFSGLFENGKGPATGGETRIAGQLHIGNGFNVGFDTAARVRFSGAGVLNVTGAMDTWWANGSIFDITGSGGDITVSDIFYLGPAATLNANISSASITPVKVQNQLSIQGGTLNANFTGGFVPNINDSWILFDAAQSAGQITNVNGTGLPPGTRLNVEYGPGGMLGQAVTLNVDATLNLRVDVGTGAMTIQNPAVGATAMSIDGYIIKSASSSLNAAGFSGVGAAGWLPGLPPSQGNGVLSETNFNGSLSVGQGSTFPIGSAFGVGGTPDLDFTFHLASGEILRGTVEYVGTPGFPADFDDDGDVDGADLQDWRGAFGPGSGADADGDGDSDGSDFLTWQRTVGSGPAVAAAAAIPEPATMGLLLIGVAATFVARRQSV
jgi:hypothetical protein